MLGDAVARLRCSKCGSSPPFVALVERPAPNRESWRIEPIPGPAGTAADSAASGSGAPSRRSASAVAVAGELQGHLVEYDQVVPVDRRCDRDVAITVRLIASNAEIDRIYADGSSLCALHHHCWPNGCCRGCLYADAEQHIGRPDGRSAIWQQLGKPKGAMRCSSDAGETHEMVRESARSTVAAFASDLNTTSECTVCELKRLYVIMSLI